MILLFLALDRTTQVLQAHRAISCAWGSKPWYPPGSPAVPAAVGGIAAGLPLAREPA